MQAARGADARSDTVIAATARLLAGPGGRRVLRWLLVLAAAAVLALATRAYLDPAAIIDLANTQLCGMPAPVPDRG